MSIEDLLGMTAAEYLDKLRPAVLHRPLDNSGHLFWIYNDKPASETFDTEYILFGQLSARIADCIAVAFKDKKTARSCLSAIECYSHFFCSKELDILIEAAKIAVALIGKSK